MNPTFDDMIGKPFLRMGRGPEGYDCWGVVIEVGWRFGVVIPDYDVYACDSYRGNARHYSEHVGEYVKVDEARGGDVVVWKRVDGGLHFGGMINGTEFLTTNPGTGVCKNSLGNPLVKQLVEGIYRCR